MGRDLNPVTFSSNKEEMEQNTGPPAPGSFWGSGQAQGRRQGLDKRGGFSFELRAGCEQSPGLFIQL